MQTINIPEKLSSWLYYSHSLTDKLKNEKGQCSLALLSQGWATASWWDKYNLLINEPFIYQREILMQAENITYWYARSVIPKSCYELNEAFFKRLEKESIRNLIFESDDVKRIDFKVYAIDNTCIEYHWLKPYLPLQEERLWLRLAHYSYCNQASFFLIEILLPSLEELS